MRSLILTAALATLALVPGPARAGCTLNTLPAGAVYGGTASAAYSYATAPALAPLQLPAVGGYSLPALALAPACPTCPDAGTQALLDALRAQSYGAALATPAYVLPPLRTVTYRTYLPAAPIQQTFAFRTAAYGGAGFVPTRSFTQLVPVSHALPVQQNFFVGRGFAPAPRAVGGFGGGGLGRVLGLAATGAGAFAGASFGGPLGAIFGGIAGQAVGEAIQGGFGGPRAGAQRGFRRR